MLKIYDFECQFCQKVFEDLVEDILGLPEKCPMCSSTESFTKVLSASNLANTIIVSYPGSKQFKAGYQHTHARPAEKKSTQFSMFSGKK
jgi:putative FmdB family regulatory protein